MFCFVVHIHSQMSPLKSKYLSSSKRSLLIYKFCKSGKVFSSISVNYQIYGLFVSSDTLTHHSDVVSFFGFQAFILPILLIRPQSPVQELSILTCSKDTEFKPYRRLLSCPLFLSPRSLRGHT